MGLISKIKEGLKHDSSSDRASLNSGADMEISSPVPAPAQDAIDVVHEQSADGAIAAAEKSKVVADESGTAEVAEKDAAANISSAAAANISSSSSAAAHGSLTEVAVTDAQSEAVAEAARRAADEAAVEAEVTVIDRGVEDVQVRERDAVVHEKQNLHERLEVQPVVQKEVDETEIRQVVQPVVDVQRERSEEQRVLETENRELVEEIGADEKARYEQQANAYEDKRERGDTSAETVVHAAKVQEVHKKHIITEIQPVIQRDILHTHVIKTVQPIHEHVVAGAKVEELKINAPITMEEFRAKTATAGAAEVETVDSAASVRAVRAEPVAVAVEKTAIREP